MLPSSGQLSLGDIATELGVAHLGVSLRSMSGTAGKSTPDAVSEFYGYSALTTVGLSISATDMGGGSISVYIFSDTAIDANSSLTVSFSLVGDDGQGYLYNATIASGGTSTSGSFGISNSASLTSYGITGASPDPNGSQTYSY